MKKLMFAAAVAATGMTFAATPEGQVYDVQLSIKSTAAATATINNKTNPFLGDTKEEVIYRKQASYTWKGLIWGCSCEAIDGVWDEVNEVLEKGYSTIKGCILWDTKAKEAVYIGNGADINDVSTADGTGFGWDFINAIDKTGKKCEGSWEMTQVGSLCEEDPGTEDNYVFKFRGAGFGNLNIVGDPTDPENCGGQYVKNISGNFAGWMVAPDETSVKDPSGCTFCGYDPGSSTCRPSAAWDYCVCTDASLLDELRTAAYGTWSVKYNSSLSKKLSKPVKISKKEGLTDVVVSIRDAYNFNSLPLVAAKIAAIENTFWQIDPTGCDKLEDALTEATKNLKEANEIAAAVSYESLKADLEAAKKVYSACVAALADAEKAYNATNSLYLQYKNEAYEQALFMTNTQWKIDYLNKSTVAANMNGTGLKTFDAANEELKGFTLTGANYGADDFGPTVVYADINKYVAAQNATNVMIIAKLDATAANLAIAEQAVKDAQSEVDNANEGVIEATNRFENRVYLQVEAAKNVDKAETAYEAAKKAYDDKCGE